ncbi:MAG: DUF58 domain-containing protein [Deltaproteobacteria bacterium]|nr:DUF58 domain-containing protein [Deltaproteobacteria bacterium]
MNKRLQYFDGDFLKQLELLHIISKKIVVGRERAERKAKRIGSGVEFADHREYVLGDDLRYLDWNAYGRSDRMLLRLFQEEEDLHVNLIVDGSASMAAGHPTKFDTARRLAAALGYIALANLDRVGVTCVDDAVRARSPASRGRSHIFHLFDFLSGLEPGAGTDLATAVKNTVHGAERRGMAVLLSDFFDAHGYENAIRWLVYRRYSPIVIQIVDDAPTTTTLRGDVELVDCESGRTLAATLSPTVHREYRDSITTHEHNLERFCTENNVLYFRAPVQQPFQDVVLRLFRAGRFLK